MKLTAFLLIAQAILVGAFLFRSDKRLSDFPAFYTAVRLWQKGEQPYNLENQCREQRQFKRSECLPFVHPPVLLPVLSLLVTENFVASYWRWVVLLIGVLGFCFVPLYQLTREVPATLQALLWQPVVASVWIGQDTVFVFAGILFWAWLLKMKRDFLAGLAVSVAAIKPHFAIALVIPLLFSRPKAFSGSLVGGTALILYSLALVGIEGFREIVNTTAVMAQGEGFGIWREGMCNVAGLLARAGVNAPGIVWAVFLLGIITISFYWHRRGVTLKTISLALVILMFTAPHVHPWDIAPLALALGGVMPLMLSSMLLFALMPYRLMHYGCYAVMLAIYARIMRSA